MAGARALRVLVVDDEADIVDFLRDVLTPEGYEVQAARDGAGAIALVRSSIFDAALLDFELPDMNGVMLHRQIRLLDEDLARSTVFISGRVQSDANLGYYTAQAGGFLAKPLEVREVVKTVRRLVTPGS
jgi:DNA-binding response OmpR family regulator